MTVIEVMVAFLIISLVVGVSIHYTNQIIFNKKIQTSKENLATLKSNIISVFSGDSGDYIGLTKESAIAANIYPEGMIKDGDLLKNVWGGDVLIYSTGDKSRSFVIKLKDVPQKACHHLSRVKDFDIVHVNKKRVDNNTDISIVCSQNNTIKFQTN